MNEIRKDYKSPRITSEIVDCSLPVSLDTYSVCSFNCAYCFSQFQRGIGENEEKYKAKKVSCVDPERIRAIFTGQKKSSFWGYLKDKRPIQYGALSDQFDGFEKKYGVTLEILKIMKELDWPISFSTKSTWVFEDERYRQIFQGQDNWSMKFSIVTLDEAAAKKVEVGVPSPEKRLKAMQEYTELNRGGAVLRLRPFIPGLSEKTYLDLITAAHDHGATAVSTEFMCLETRSESKELTRKNYERLSEAVGFDIVDFYHRYSPGSGYLRLNRKIKRPYIEKMKKLCDQLGMDFYVSDAGFKELSSTCCCCGLKEGRYSRGNFSEALQIARREGKVHWSDISEDTKWADFSVSAPDIVFNSGSWEKEKQFEGSAMADYLHYLWNSPKEGRSPYKEFGYVLIPDGVDENGDIVYRFNPKVSTGGEGDEKQRRETEEGNRPENF